MSLRLPEHCSSKTFISVDDDDPTVVATILCYKLSGHKSEEHVSATGYRWKDSDGQR